MKIVKSVFSLHPTAQCCHNPLPPPAYPLSNAQADQDIPCSKSTFTATSSKTPSSSVWEWTSKSTRVINPLVALYNSMHPGGPCIVMSGAPAALTDRQTPGNPPRCFQVLLVMKTCSRWARALLRHNWLVTLCVPSPQLKRYFLWSVWSKREVGPP